MRCLVSLWFRESEDDSDDDIEDIVFNLRRCVDDVDSSNFMEDDDLNSKFLENIEANSISLVEILKIT
ncbi:unnamed protein product [Rhizophagus irregularis]|nr:unnamed protein product [Rhizophagus irregularis]